MISIRYELDTNIYASIIPEQSVTTIVRRGVRVTLRKMKTGPTWPRLTKSPFKLPWLTRDYEEWPNEWESDTEDNPLAASGHMNLDAGKSR